MPTIARPARFPWLTDPAEQAPRERIVTAAAVSVAVALAWPARGDLVGLDQSWVTGLHAAAQLGLRHGVDFVFTYGPLGYVTQPWPFLGWTTAAAIAFTLLAKLGLAALVARAARATLALPLTLVVLLVVMRLLALQITAGELIALLVLLASWHLLAADRRTWPDPILALGGVLAAVAILGKLNAGVVVLAMVGIVAVATGRPWWRGLLVALGSFLVAGFALWLATGQHLEDVPMFLSTARETVSGYTAAMARASSGPPLARVDALVELGFMTALGSIGTRDWPRHRRIALAAVWLAFAGSIYLEGFTRDDAGHNALFFVAMAVAVVPVLPRGRPWAAAAIIAVFVTIAASSAPRGPQLLLNPLPSLDRLVGDLVMTARPGTWDEEADRTRAAIRAAYRLDARLGERLAGRTVHVDPIDAAVAVALPASRWNPLPAFQSYGAYTTALDELNASVLAGPRAPEVILRRQAPLGASLESSTVEEPEDRALGIDGRLLWWDQPAATLEMLCRYREEGVLGEWQVVALGPSRCGPATALNTVTAGIGDVVTVPEPPGPDQVLVVRVSPLPGNPVRSLRDLALGARPWMVVVDGVRHRLVPGTVGDGLILAVPQRLGWSPAFAFGPRIRSLAFTGGELSGQVMLRFETITLGPA